MGRPISDPFWKPKDIMGITPPVLEKEPYIVVMVDEFTDLMIMTVGKKSRRTHCPSSTESACGGYPPGADEPASVGWM